MRGSRNKKMSTLRIFCSELCAAVPAGRCLVGWLPYACGPIEHRVHRARGFTWESRRGAIDLLYTRRSSFLASLCHTSPRHATPRQASARCCCCLVHSRCTCANEYACEREQRKAAAAAAAAMRERRVQFADVIE